jgi:hypothetical protein
MKMLLPKTRWLERNGYHGLLHAMRTQPHLFEHIKQEKEGLTPEQWVPVAEQLARNNGGVLPHYASLVRAGVSGLTGAMRRKPELFSHILQAKKSHTLREHVLLAETLASSNVGQLQNQRWLLKNGHAGLARAVAKHPRMFAHIPQVRLKTNGQPA